MEIKIKKTSEKSDEINLTQLILNFLIRYQNKIDYNRFKDILIKIKNNMEKRPSSKEDSAKLNPRCNKTFRMINDQYLSNELWYWISNDYIRKQYGSEDPSEIEKPFLKLTPKAKERIPDLLEQTINWNLSEETKSSLDEIIDLIISQMNSE